MTHLPTIHDFYGFPDALYAVEYLAPGSPALASAAAQALAPTPVGMDSDWGLDHDTWSVLCHMYSEANVPVVQLSLDITQGPEYHYALGQQLAVPTPEHYLPLYILGLHDGAEPLAISSNVLIGGSISMTCVRVG